MTVPNEVNKAGPFNGNGVTRVFPFDFRIISRQHLRVIRRTLATNTDMDLVLGVGYGVTGEGNISGGNITTTVAPAVGQQIIILRNVPFTQDVDLENQGAYFAETIEQSLDLAVMRDQQMAETLSRAITVPPGEGAGGDLSTRLRDGILRLSDSADNIDLLSGIAPDIETVSDISEDVTNVSRNMTAITSASGSVMEIEPARFTGNGSQDTFILPVPATSTNNVLVWVDNIKQIPGEDYSAISSSLVFTTAPGSGADIDVAIVTAVSFSNVRAQATRAEQAAALALVHANAAAASANEASLEVSRVLSYSFPRLNGVGGLLQSPVVVAQGSIIETRSENFSYQVLASGDATADLVTAGGVRLRVLPNSGNILHMEAFAPAGNAASDDAPVVKRWLERGFVLRNVQLRASTRVWLHTKVDAHFPVTGSGMPIHTVTVDCAGATFILPEVNTDGGIKITSYNNAQHMAFQNMDIYSDMPIGTLAVPHPVTSGTGLEFYYFPRPGEPGWGTTQQVALRLYNVKVASTWTGNRGRWNRGIVIDGYWWPTLISCDVSTRHPADKTVKVFESGDGIHIRNSYSPFLYSCMSLGRWRYNIMITDNTGVAWEDFQVTGCYGVGGQIGLGIIRSNPADYGRAATEPGGCVIGGHYNGQQHAIRVNYARQFSIIGPLLYTTLAGFQSTYSDAAGVSLTNCQDWSITVNMPQGGHFASLDDCTSGVRMNGTTSNGHIVNCQFGIGGVGVFSRGIGGDIFVSGTRWTGSGGQAVVRKIFDLNRVLSGPDVINTITPAMRFGGNAAGIAYSEQTGGIVEIGQTVTFWVDVSVTARGSSTGDASIVAGLPAPYGGSDFAATISYSSGVNVQVFARIGVDGSIALFKLNASGGMVNPLQHSDLLNVFSLRLSGTYIKAY